ncbi:MAG: hypothetical protein WA484_04730 [Solirubrobacteraceae bacterium]
MEFRVHSVDITSGQPDQYTAFLPIAEDAPDLWGDIGSDQPIFDAEVIKAPRSSRVARGRPTLLYSALEVDDDLVLEGPGLQTAVLRVDPDAKEFLSGPAAIVPSKILGRVGPGIRLRGIPIRFEPDPAQEPWSASIWLPVAYIHRPNRRNCKSVYTLTDKNISTYDAQFLVGGSGVKGQAKFSVEFTRELPASKTCKEAKIRATVSVVFGTVYLGDKPIFHGTQIEITDIDPDDREYADIPAECDQCGWPIEQAPKLKQTIEHLRGATGGVDDAPVDRYKIEREVAGTMSVGLELNRLPISMSLAYTRTCAYTSTLETRLMPGADYLGYLPRLENPLEKCWTVLAP